MDEKLNPIIEHVKKHYVIYYNLKRAYKEAIKRIVELEKQNNL